MKVAVFVGSARRKGNTEVLIRQAMKGAGCPDGQKITFLSDVDFKGCFGCGACRGEGAHGCVVEDGMQRLYEEIKAADALILGSPIYYGEISGQMKSFMDRWYAFRAKDRSLRVKPGKKVLFLLTQGAEGEDRYINPINRLKKVLSGYEMLPEVLVADDIEEKGSAAEKPELLERLLQAGKRLKGKEKEKA
ncbi:MAG TPA: flavodoxin family protein [Nitrospirota bacterium]